MGLSSIHVASVIPEIGRKIVTILLFSAPTVLAVVVLLARAKSTRVRVSLAAALFWTLASAFLGYRGTLLGFSYHWGGFLYTPIGLLLNLPLFVSISVTVAVGGIVRGHYFVLKFLHIALTYAISYFIVFHIYRFISNRKTLPRETGDNDQAQGNG